MSKFTEWYPSHIKPVRNGVYQQYSLGDIGYQYWDGARWSCWNETVKSAYINRFVLAGWAYQNDPWRGLRK